MANFEDMNLFDFFGMEEESQQKPQASEKEELSSDVNMSDDLDLADDDDEGVEEEETTSTPTPTKKKSKKAKDADGTVKVSLPTVVNGRNWSVEIDEFGEITLNELVKRVYDMGFVEVAHPDVLPIIGITGSVYFKYPSTETASDVNVIIPSAGYTVAEGMEQLPVENIEGMEVSEYSVFDMQEQWTSQFPAFSTATLAIDNETAVAVPVYSRAADEIALPIKVVKFGTVTELTAEVMGKNTMSAEDILSYVASSEKEQLNCFLYKMSSDIYCVEVTEKSPTKAVKALDRKYAVKNTGATNNEKAKVFVTLPVNVWFATVNQQINLTSDHFEGKSKVTEAEVLEYLKSMYSILRNKDRRVDVLYSKEQNIFSVALVSGSKGAVGDSPAASFSSLGEYFVGLNHEGNRLEINPVGRFVGDMKKGEVSFRFELPKIPLSILDEIVDDFRAHPQIERIVQIIWDGDSYYVRYPDAELANKGFIRYEFNMLPPGQYIVMTIHSHNTMKPYFSKTDDHDEAITGLYGVVGLVDTTPTIKCRVGMEGMFSPVNVTDIFEGGGSYDN